ncbi:polysaccharide deacetylase family protein [Schleiferia thermophila]|uniref:polysaccharide deacetylase family protein n=1 Tax=Schleiferia thermophila TaxID=884107 RepID=UPI001F2826AA|nr:polysaccharide deacetylase family protein [Schleiferia thermophila]
MAAPLLKNLNMPATFFIVPGWVSVFPDYLTWPEVWLLSQERDTIRNSRLFHIGSHTMYHPFLEQMANQMSSQDYQTFLDEEIGESRDWILDVTGQNKLFLALPFGDGANNKKIIDTCKKFGYTGIRHSIWNTITQSTLNIWSIPSLPILSFTEIEVIDDWLD